MSYTGNFPKFNKISADGKEVYFGDPNTDGSYRFVESGGSIHLEKRVASVWTDLGDILTEAPINAAIAALDIDWSTAEVFYKDVSANTTFTFSNVQDGKTIIVIVNNTAVGTVTVDFPTALKASGFSGDIDASSETVFTFVASNSKVYATAISNMV